MHDPLPSQGQWLRQVVTGFFAYHAVPTNFHALAAFRYHIMVLWMRTLTRRSQKDRTGWDRINRLADQWLPKPRILHPWPNRASPSNIQGGSRMRECRTSGSVRGVPSNGHPYRDPRPKAEVRCAAIECPLLEVSRQFGAREQFMARDRTGRIQEGEPNISST